MKKLKYFKLTHEAIRMPKSINFSVESSLKNLIELIELFVRENRSVKNQTFLETTIQAMKLRKLKSAKNVSKQAIEAIKA